jgi:hypothetical protein
MEWKEKGRKEKGEREEGERGKGTLSTDSSGIEGM